MQKFKWNSCPRRYDFSFKWKKTAVNNDNVKKEYLQIDTISSNLELNQFNSDSLNDLNIFHKK